jgi:hypothetical protein
MWGRNCPVCKKYFRTNHIYGLTYCPYCAIARPGLDFTSQAQWTYITAFYDAFMKTYITGKPTQLEASKISDHVPAWHYQEEKQQLHFTCETENCRAESDILGRFGYCPRCGRTNARRVFFDRLSGIRSKIKEASQNPDREARREVWEDITSKLVSEFEAFMRHLAIKLLTHRMTASRRRALEALNFQKPFDADRSLEDWFDISVSKWEGIGTRPRCALSNEDTGFVKRMFQKRHILVHNGGVVDSTYIELSGDTQVQLMERIRVSSKEVIRFVAVIEVMARNFLDNIEMRLEEGR